MFPPVNSPLERLAAALSDRYHLERELGVGGMATVYLAEDVKHKRRVAVKVLKPELAAVLGAERFVQEITTTAALQHPHILPLFDSGEADGFLYYVMPFIDGETLRSKLDRETQLGVDEAVRIASDVAGALHYAHTHGVIHRDIKPENILLHDGRPMVADFGIALAVSAAAGGRMTETGLSLGTPHYMSPEQATAEKEITARSDVYSIGSVLYEMLTGNPPHTGASAQQIIMKIITEQPQNVTVLRKSVPRNVAAAVSKALEKLPADRFESAAAFAAALADAHFTTATGTSGARGFHRSRAVPATVVLIAVTALAATAGWAIRGWTSRVTPRMPIRFATTMGRLGSDRPHIGISSDGRLIVQSVTDSDGRSRLMMRDLTTNTLSLIAGTEGAMDGAEFSPNGEWLAFVANGGLLRKIAVSGGPTTTLVDSLVAQPGGMAWSTAGDLIFPSNSGLWRLPTAGGAPVQLTRLDSVRKEFAHWAPQLLPGERTVIYTSYATPVARSRIEALDLKSGRVTVLAEGGVFARYSPTGHLLYSRDNAVFAIAFDADRVKTSGDAVPVQDDVVWSATDGRAAYAVSSNGTFAYLSNAEYRGDFTVVWRDRAGRDTELIGTPGDYDEPRLSPDGRWVAVTVRRPKSDVWLYDIGRRALNQLTRAPAFAFNGVWLPDSRRIVYTFEQDGRYDLHIIPIDASAPDRVLLASPFDKYAQASSSDGGQLLFSESVPQYRLMTAPVDGSSPPKQVIAGEVEQRLGAVSPDRSWIAYSELVGGQRDIYIRPLRGTGGRQLVSSGNATQPRWTKGGREIVFMSDATMMSASLDPATGAIGAPVKLFTTSDLVRGTSVTYSYDVTPSGDRFLLVKRIERPGAQPLVVVLNWRPDLGKPVVSGK